MGGQGEQYGSMLGLLGAAEFIAYRPTSLTGKHLPLALICWYQMVAALGGRICSTPVVRPLS